MTKLIIDPGLFEVPEKTSLNDQLEHFMFLKDSIDFVSDFFQVSLDEYDGAPYSCNSQSHPYAPPITKSLIIRNRYSEISKKILKLVSRGEWIELQDKSIDDCSLEFVDNTAAEIQFKQYLYYIFCADIQEKSLLLLSQKNCNCVPSTSFRANESTYNLSTVYSPAEDCSGIVSKYFKQSTEVDSIFPQLATCFRLNDKFKEALIENEKTVSERIPIYIKFGTEVACRNNYLAKPDISRKNPSYEVFVHKLGTFYLSIDVEHGALEVFKDHGKHPLHLGEYDFSCIQNKGAEPETHKLIV